MLIKATIDSLKKLELCKQEKKVDVDCCKKAFNLRLTEIWWEDFGTCQPYIVYPGVVYNAICKMPQTIPMGGPGGLFWYACVHPYKPLYGIPEIKGSCLPLKWELNGSISFFGSSKENDYLIFLKCGKRDCRSKGSITLTDRCGSIYHVRVKPCCEESAILSINYTSLQMICVQQQTFSATGGCDPYVWSLSGGGELSPIEGTETTYTAPANNPNCEDTPTITLTDCCGNTATITIYVTCPVVGEAFAVSKLSFSNTNCISGACYADGQCSTEHFGCDNTLQNSCYGSQYGQFCYCTPDADCDPCTPEKILDLTEHYDATMGCGGTYDGVKYWNTCVDYRTQDMKDAGCCPINPQTGLPF